MRKLAFIFTTLLLIIGAGAARAEGPVTLDQYREHVAQALQLVERAVAQPQADARQPLLAQAAELLNQIQEVQLDNGTRMPVDNAGLAEMVKGAASKPQDAEARLQALRASLTQLPTAASDDDRAKLRDLMNRPPFTEDNTDPLQKLWQAIQDKIDALLSNTAQGIYDWRDLVTALGILLLVVVLVFFLWNLRRNLVPEATLKSAPAGEANLTSTGALHRAQQFASAGDYRTAVRQLYLATLLWLDEHGRLRYDHALTNREYLQAAANEPALVAALRPVVEAFDRIWYGFEAVTPEEFNAYLEQVNGVRKL